MSSVAEDIRKITEWAGEDSDVWWDVEYGSHTIPGVGITRYVESYGGEGMGDERWLVFELTPEDGRSPYLLKKNAYYSSYDGTDWDGDLRQVEAYQKTITDYRAV